MFFLVTVKVELLLSNEDFYYTVVFFFTQHFVNCKLHDQTSQKVCSPCCCCRQTRSSELRRASESEIVRLDQKVLQLEAEQETILSSLGKELDSACRSLARNGEDKLQVFLLLLVFYFPQCCLAFFVFN